MTIQSTAFYIIGLIVIWILGEIRNKLSLITQRLKWINEDIQKLTNKPEEN